MSELAEEMRAGFEELKSMIGPAGSPADDGPPAPEPKPKAEPEAEAEEKAEAKPSKPKRGLGMWR